ncbi:hypothetical protein V9N53_003386 [Vibrio cholerae]
MAITRATIENMIQKCVDAELEVLAGKTVTYGGRSVGMESLSEIRAARREWERKLQSLNRRGQPSYKVARFT